MNKKRILTGDRPTGKLHLGHYVGSLANRVKLQDEYDCYFIMADIQALTDNFDHPEMVREAIREVAMDNLAVGIDPQKATIFIQSQIPEIAELTVYFMNLVTLARLQRNPTVKDEMKQRGFGENIPVGFLVYPISQAADILVVRANLVPVGEDQLPHIEQTREIARKFNSIYGEVFPEPEGLVGEFPRLPGIDGKAKMSKSLGNCIYLSDNAKTVEEKVRNMYTDPTRIHPTDPGHVEGNPVFIYLDAFGSTSSPQVAEKVAEYKKLYEKGKLGDVEVKKYLAAVLNEFLEPIRQRRKKFEKNPGLIDQILKEGTQKARLEAQETLKLARQAMGLPAGRQV